jgi:crotonobetainyl-CoA:carnitine CoA-transferase CaiB-like acyl-CoA transferase
MPLAGLKVLDAGMFLAGPFAPMLLADLGADVIKLEPPTGDRMRGSELMFVACQRGKRSVALDLRHPEARTAFEALVRWADVVHHNLRMPAARALGLDEDSVRAINPKIIYSHVSSYGSLGARADWPGYDPVAQAASGFMVEGAGAGNPPMWTRFGMMDHQAALSSLLPTLLALYHFQCTGTPGRVDASLLGAAVMVNSETMVLPDGTFAEVPHLDSDQRLLRPGHGIYQVADGWIAVAARGHEAVNAMLSCLSAADHDAFETELRCRERDAVLADLELVGVPCAPVNLDHEQSYFDDPQLRRHGYTVAYEHPVYGLLEQPGAAWDFGDLRLQLDRPPPVLGQHGREVLNQLGVSDDQIAHLVSITALKCPDIGGRT